MNNNKTKVYPKLDNKTDHIHFYLHHNTKIKIALIIGFYFSPKSLNELN